MATALKATLSALAALVVMEALALLFADPDIVYSYAFLVIPSIALGIWCGTYIYTLPSEASTILRALRIVIALGTTFIVSFVTLMLAWVFLAY